MSVTFDSTHKSAQITLSNNNLTETCTAGITWRTAASTGTGNGLGKYYCEFVTSYPTSPAQQMAGVGNKLNKNWENYPGGDVTENSVGINFVDGKIWPGSISYGSAFNSGDIAMVAFDSVNGEVWFGKNGVWFASGNPATRANPAFTNKQYLKDNNGLDTVFMACTSYADRSITAHFSTSSFVYTPPEGFVELNDSTPVTPTVSSVSSSAKIDSILTLINVTPAVSTVNSTVQNPTVERSSESVADQVAITNSTVQNPSWILSGGINY